MQMKKILFCAGILALAASCAENEIDSISGQKEATKEYPGIEIVH